MASGGFKSNKPELIAIYRLEFYKNKKKWKFSNERRKESLQPPQTKSTQNLNKTYDVEPSYDSEKETSPLNNAFMHEIPTDDTPEDMPSAPPPTPQPPEEIWQHQGTEPGPILSNTDIWVNSGIQTGSETYQEAQTTETLTNCRIDAVQQSLAPCMLHNQPANNLQTLLQTNPDPADNQPKIESWRPKTDFWINDQAAGSQNLRIQQPWSNQTSEIGSSSCIPKNIWTSAASAINPELFHQNSLSTPTSASPLPDTGMLASLLKTQGLNLPYQKDGTIPQAPPANCLQILMCPDKWKKQAKAVSHQNDQSNSRKTNPGFWSNPALATDAMLLQNQKQNKPNSNPDSWRNQMPSTPPPFSKRLNPNIWLNHQNIPQNFPLDSQNSSQCVSQMLFTNQRSASPQNLAKPVHKSLMSHQDPEIKGPLPSPDKYPADTWCESQKTPNTWTNPALSSNPEAIQQYVWSNQAWQKQEDLRQNSDQELAPTAEDVPEAECNEDLHSADLQYIEVDQNTLKPQGSLDSEMLTPEQIRRSTDEWLRRLLALYRPKDECNNDFETGSDHNQGGLNDSTDFIREAHEVPHSSEKDPNETRECVCSYLPSCSLPALSSRRLSAALQHATKVLRDVLREQLIRDRLRSSTLLNVVEYPTRDTDLFGSEYVMGGSHVPHWTRDLTRPPRPPGGERVIKIDMGRPYRL